MQGFICQSWALHIVLPAPYHEYNFTFVQQTVKAPEKKKTAKRKNEKSGSTPAQKKKKPNPQEEFWLPNAGYVKTLSHKVSVCVYSNNGFFVLLFVFSFFQLIHNQC